MGEIYNGDPCTSTETSSEPITNPKGVVTGSEETTKTTTSECSTKSGHNPGGQDASGSSCKGKGIEFSSNTVESCVVKNKQGVVQEGKTCS
jgi:hypothetical protein